MANRIDDIDATIFELVHKRGLVMRNAVADVVGLSVSAVSERMRKLEERGVLESYHAVVNPKRLHFDITAIIRVSVDGSEHYPAFVEQATSMEEVLELHSITGDGSHVMKVRTKNTTSLERFLSRVQGIAGVSSTSTSIVLSTFKETRALPTEPTELFDHDDEAQ